jgi:hypothetical protein
VIFWVNEYRGSRDNFGISLLPQVKKGLSGLEFPRDDVLFASGVKAEHADNNTYNNAHSLYSLQGLFKPAAVFWHITPSFLARAERESSPDRAPGKRPNKRKSLPAWVGWSAQLGTKLDTEQLIIT